MLTNLVDTIHSIRFFESSNTNHRHDKRFTERETNNLMIPIKGKSKKKPLKSTFFSRQLAYRSQYLFKFDDDNEMVQSRCSEAAIRMWCGLSLENCCNGLREAIVKTAARYKSPVVDYSFPVTSELSMSHRSNQLNAINWELIQSKSIV